MQEGFLTDPDRLSSQLVAADGPTQVVGEGSRALEPLGKVLAPDSLPGGAASGARYGHLALVGQSDPGEGNGLVRQGGGGSSCFGTG